MTPSDALFTFAIQLQHIDSFMKRGFFKTIMASGVLATWGLGLQAQAPCVPAVALSCNSTTNTETTVGGFPKPSNNSWLTAASDWYTFAGNGQVVRLRTSAAYDAKITVGSYSSGATTCLPDYLIGTNDNGRGLGNNPANRDAEISWFAKQGVQYVIIVHGAAGQTGTYQLNLGCVGSAAPANDACAGAKRMFDCITDINLTTHTATNENFLHPEDGLTNSNRGVWFRASNIVGEHVLTSCGETEFDNRLFVWQVAPGGGCPDVTTVAPNFFNDDQCVSLAEVTFNGIAGRDYLILMDGYNGTHFGKYSLDLCFPASKQGQAQTLASTSLTASPNPANTQVRFDYTVQQDGAVAIALYNLAGQQVATVQSDALQAGMSASADLDVSALPAGMYVYRAQIDGQLQSGKLHIAH
jgi:Secretion system C-terminal sorting domain